MLRETRQNCTWLIKTHKFFHMTSRKQTIQGGRFMKERQPNSPEHKDRSGWQRRDTRLHWLMWPSTQLIGKDIRASSYFFTRGRLIYFLRFALLQWPKIAMWASCDGPQGDWSRSDIGMISVNFNSYASLVIIFLILVLFCFVFDHETLLTIRVLAVFDFYYCT